MEKFNPTLEFAMNNKPTVPEGEVIDRYVSALYGIITKCCGEELQPHEIIEGIRYSIGKRYHQQPLKIHNSHTHKIGEMDVLSLANELLKDGAILTTQGVLFSKHGSVKNPFYNFIQYLLDKRDEAKKEMKKHPKGSELWKKYNLLQLNYKVACNALYGCAGNWTSVYYNLYLCTAVTGQGRGCISASITMFEGFLANNMKFANLTEVMTFIENICMDQHKPQKFKDWDVLDRNVTVEECFLKLIRNCGYDSWVPSDKAVDLIWQTVNNLNQRELNVVYYTNNLYEFVGNTRVMNLIMKILIDLEAPFLNPLKPPENVKDDLVMLKDLMYEYVYYRHLWIDKLKRVYTMTRDVVLLTDTDSCIVSLDQWYRFVLERTIGIPMRIKYTQVQRLEAADKVVLEFQRTRMESEYDFYNQKMVDAKRLKYPAVVIEEDSLRYSIINIMSYVVGELILDYMKLFADNYNTSAPDRECLLIMKNEFLFKSILLTKGRKNYSTIQVVQEGNLIPEDKQFDIKGMPIAKVGISQMTAKILSDILEFDVLRTSFVDQVDIIKKFATIEQMIYQSIKEKNKDYHKPARIKSLSNYETPMRIQGIKASVAYNNIKGPDEEGINLDERNTVLIIKTNINIKTMDKIMKTYPEHYLRLKKLLEKPDFKGKVEAIAIPMNVEIPDWIVPFINYSEIIHDNLRNFPMEEIGLSKMENTDITHTNMIVL